MKAFYSAAIFIHLAFTGFAQGSWQQKLSMPGGARISASSFIINGNGYVVGGSAGNTHFNDMWKYDPVTDSWTQQASLPAGGRENGIAAVVNGKGYYGSGSEHSNYFSDWWEYDATVNLWTAKAIIPGQPRAGAFAFSAGNFIYAGTGTDGTTKLSDMYAYNPVTDSWLAVTTFPTGGIAYAGTFSINGKGYVICGLTTGNTNATWEYDPATAAWTARSNFGGSVRYNPVAWSDGISGYAGLGWGPSSALQSDMWTYNPTTDVWSQVTSMPFARGWATAFAIGSKGYVYGGRTAAQLSNSDLWEYNPAVTGVAEINNDEWQAYPLITSGIIYFKGRQIPASIRIMNAEGQFIKFVNNADHINLSGCKDGVYFLRDDKHGTVIKLILQH